MNFLRKVYDNFITFIYTTIAILILLALIWLLFTYMVFVFGLVVILVLISLIINAVQGKL